MKDESHQFIRYIALLAACSGQANEVQKREKIGQWAEMLGDSAAAGVLRFQRNSPVIRIDPGMADRYLDNRLHRLLAYEMAVSICHFDGRLNASGRHFLAHLSWVLGLHGTVTRPLDQQAAGIAEVAASLAEQIDRQASASAETTAAGSSLRHLQCVLDYAIHCAALEMHPESWASMSIHPLQVSMVRAIAKQHGHDEGPVQLRARLETLGLGLTPQFVEHLDDKLFGGIRGRMVTFLPSSFSTTYALGQVAAMCYANGQGVSDVCRTNDYEKLRDSALSLQMHHLRQIREKAAGLTMKLKQ